MFDKTYEERLSIWKNFRDQLENDPEPFYSVLRFFDDAPRVPIHIDPWDSNNWPDPWELIYENQYCEFTKVLAICYTLKLTTRFSNTPCEILIVTNQQLSESTYLLKIENYLINWRDSCILVRQLPEGTEIKQSYDMTTI